MKIGQLKVRLWMIIKLIVLVQMMQLTACQKTEKESKDNIITVNRENVANTLFYSGTIAPLQATVITTPAEGVIIEMPFQYGEAVKRGQLLFMISSAKYLSDYKAALLAYVKAKSEFNNAELQLNEAKFLYKNKLIPLDEFKTKQSNYYGSQLGYIQAKDTLENLLQQLADREINLESLNIANIEKVTAAMHLQMNSENLRIVSPADGIILASVKGEEENKKVGKGDPVKQGDVLAVIGDMKGISVRIKVNELTVNQLKVGQKVRVSGIAFSDYVLEGVLERIDRQGEASNGGLPNFSAMVIVPKLNSMQQKIIHVGMSAKVEIDIQEDQQIMIPMTAITEKDGNSFVHIFDPATKKSKLAEIKTGKTTMNAVAVLSGLNVGDKIVLAH
ncbi:MAG: HlyD family efflux transporter periplasmic adaptor subunit [Gammaproteobacteria bacterium]|nr:HlyD family efflux transporter periplasmic adaptor subunit [Gammaproteobacteria bacterium]